jgi:hypothetical protein
MITTDAPPVERGDISRGRRSRHSGRDHHRNNRLQRPDPGPSKLRVRRHRQRRRDGLRLFTVTVPETAIENAIARGLLAVENRAEPWPVIEGCYAAQLSDAALARLIKGGVIAHEQRGDAVAILRSISKWLERAGSLDSH